MGVELYSVHCYVVELGVFSKLFQSVFFGEEEKQIVWRVCIHAVAGGSELGSFTRRVIFGSRCRCVEVLRGRDRTGRLVFFGIACSGFEGGCCLSLHGVCHEHNRNMLTKSYFYFLFIDIGL